MLKRRRHRPGHYQPKPEICPNFTGPKPLTVFQGEDGKWGVKDGEGNIIFNPIYSLTPQTDEEKVSNTYRLGNQFEVFIITPEDWDILAFYSPD